MTALAVVLAPAVQAAPQAGGQPRSEDTFSGNVQVTAVDLVVDVHDAEGRVPGHLVPADFEVIEDGEPQLVIAVDSFDRTAAGGAPVANLETGGRTRSAPTAIPWSWRTVIYFDQILSSSRSIRRAAAALADQARRLTALGTVEIVAANPTAKVVLPSTRSSQLVEQTLTRLSREAVGRDALRALRRQFIHSTQINGMINTRQTLVQANIRDEGLLLRRQHDVLMSWISSYSEPGPRALLFVNDGYDLDPREFYFASMTDGLADPLFNASMAETAAALPTHNLGETLAAGGWVAVNMALSAVETAGPVEAEMSGRGRLGESRRLGGGDAIAQMPSAVVMRPLDPLRLIAAATGGETLTWAGRLPEALERLENRVRITYQVARRADGKLHRVKVRALREGLEVKAPLYSGTPSSEAVAAARARRLLAGDPDHGDLPVVAAVALGEGGGGGKAGEAEKDSEADSASEQGGKRRGTLQARLDLSPLKDSLNGAPPSTVRVTIAASFPQGEPFIRSQEVAAQALAGLDAWTYTTPVTLPAEVERVAIVIEEGRSGGWGGALAAQVNGPLPESVQASTGVTGRTGGASAEGTGDVPADSVAELPADLLPGGKAITLLAPAEEVVTGRVRLESVVSDPRVAQVSFLVDGREAANRERPPFEARVDFGKLPAPRRVEAVAYDAKGTELGRDALTVNEGMGAFRVSIIEPRSGERMGTVDVEAEVKLPPDATLDRVDVYWNGEREATLFEPPFRARVMIPPESPMGYLTVQAVRADGATVEDVVFMNGTGGSERVDVRLVELPTVVTDPERRPVRDLPREDFRVFEEGIRQKLSDFRDAAEAPLNLGILIDTSGSMYPVLDQVKTAAIDFTVLAMHDRDRSFLVDFASRPRLVQRLTGDVDALVRAVASLKAVGGSALCDALVYSLIEMRQIHGRRALVVLTDGVGRDERVGFDTCLRMVEHSGVPIYAILLAGDDPTASAGGISEETLSRLVAPVGGKLYFAAGPGRLGQAYRSILDELRSQYLLAYYPAVSPYDEGWRSVAVTVDRPGLEARTITGYYP